MFLGSIAMPIFSPAKFWVPPAPPLSRAQARGGRWRWPLFLLSTSQSSRLRSSRVGVRRFSILAELPTGSPRLRESLIARILLVDVGVYVSRQSIRADLTVEYIGNRGQSRCNRTMHGRETRVFLG